jgi:hypothetical protein
MWFLLYFLFFNSPPNTYARLQERSVSGVAVVAGVDFTTGILNFSSGGVSMSWSQAATKFAGLEVVDVMATIDFTKVTAVPDEARTLPVRTSVGRSWPGYENEFEEDRCRRHGLFRGESLAHGTPQDLLMCDAFKVASSNVSATFCACAWAEPMHELWFVRATMKSCQLIVRYDKVVHVGPQVVVHDASGVQHVLTCPKLEQYLWYRTLNNYLCLNSSMESELKEASIHAGVTKTTGKNWITRMDRYAIVPFGSSLHVRERHHVILPGQDCTQGGHPYFPDTCQNMGAMVHHYNGTIGLIELGA